MERINERTCRSWRCRDGCWGLPGCEHPERTPFKLPSVESLEAQVSRSRSLNRGLRRLELILGAIVLLAVALRYL